LRSDTFTQPIDEMREAMGKAAVGDDVYGEDPTVNELQAKAAERVGKEAALFMPSGTMVNQAALWVHSGRQGALACEAGAHVYYYEGGAASLLSNLLVYPIEGRRGVFSPSQLESIVPADPIHYAPIRVVAIENTHTRAGGTCWTPAQTKSIAEYCRERKIPVHLDGARVFNASVAQSVPVRALTDPADSVGFCLSKGLSAPVGSLLCGGRAFIDEARRVRKILGGGMRQAGVLAAAGLVALDKMVDRLREDHENARRLGAGLAKIEGLRVDLDAVQTNIVNFDIAGTGQSVPGFLAELARRGVKAMERDVGPVVRMVTHRHIAKSDVEATLEVVRDVASMRVAKRVRHSSQTR
ncbi:MAG: low specificity L-threonine aldolase, partial [Euryarchaeota archaeon]|nr:low specificity L-threonine aldolase [Euryarchaeota archaeon]